MFDRAALPRVAPFLAYLSFIFIADMLGRAGFAAQDLRWLYAVKIGVVLGMLLYWRRSYTELAWTPLGARALAVALATGFVVFLLWINLDAGWMTIGSADGFDPRNDGQIEWSLVVLRIAGAAYFIPNRAARTCRCITESKPEAVTPSAVSRDPPTPALLNRMSSLPNSLVAAATAAAMSASCITSQRTNFAMPL